MYMDEEVVLSINRMISAFCMLIAICLEMNKIPSLLQDGRGFILIKLYIRKKYLRAFMLLLIFQLYYYISKYKVLVMMK